MVHDMTSRFGMPVDLTGKTVLDIGTWDGMAAFEAEKRGASYVRAIDIYQKCAGQESEVFEANKPFQFAHKHLQSKVDFSFSSLEDFRLHKKPKFDVVLYYGVLYHIENPLGAIFKLGSLVADNGQVIIETSYTTDPGCVLEYTPGYAGDKTNIFRPSLRFLEKSLKEAGFSRTELIYSDKIRCTMRAFK
jgi:tRNA (mo5U34)-methyltransferase